MGPYPHDAPPATISATNPAGTDGFAFVEFAHPDGTALATLFESMGCRVVAKHRRKAIVLWRQGAITFLANAERDSHAVRFAAEHGPCAASMAWNVVNAQHAFDYALNAGAEPAGLSDAQASIGVPAIRGIGGSIIYFNERRTDGTSTYEAEFDWLDDREPAAGQHVQPDQQQDNSARDLERRQRDPERPKDVLPRKRKGGQQRKRRYAGLQRDGPTALAIVARRHRKKRRQSRKGVHQKEDGRERKHRESDDRGLLKVGESRGCGTVSKAP